MDVDETQLAVNGIYPTPMVDNLTIETNGIASESLSVDFFDITGKLIDESSLRENINVLNVTDLKPGIYFVRVYNNEELLLTRKVVKK